MPAARPLPTVIGPTENALRALLSKVLMSTRIKTYHAWVTLNAMSRADAELPDGNWRVMAAEGLRIGFDELDDIHARLCSTGLVGKDGRLTALGATELTAARSAVSGMTRLLVEGITEDEQSLTRSVLDRLRRRADELAHM